MYSRFYYAFFAVHLLIYAIINPQPQQQPQQLSQAAQLTKLAQQVQSGGSTAIGGGSQFISGLAQSFGYCPSSYTYSFQVWNDLPTPLYVAAQSITSIQGAQFRGPIDKGLVICPFQNTQDAFYKRNLCHVGIWLCADTSNLQGYQAVINKLSPGLSKAAELFTSTEELNKYKIYQRRVDVIKGDTSIYHFRTYIHKGQPRGEFLGPSLTSGPYGSTTDFDGVFYNSSDYSAQLAFTKNGQSYTITLEPHSFSLLSSDTTVPHSIRPPASSNQQSPPCTEQAQRTFDFIFGKTTVRIPIAPEGLGHLYTDQSTQATTIVPATYTYEVYDSGSGKLNVGMQGISIGNYDQPGVDFNDAKNAFLTSQPYTYPLIKRVRDTNPVRCSVWYQSAQQARTSQNTDPAQTPTQIPYDVPEQVWISYSSHDYSFQQKIAPGSITNFTLIRPQLSEAQARLYIVSLATTNDTQAQRFIKRLHTGVIGKEAVATTITNPLALPTTILTQLAPNTNGIIRDTVGVDASGIQGTVLFTDIFLPYGLDEGPYYYGIPAASLNLDASFMSSITSYLAPSKPAPDIQKVLTWITTYAKNQSVIATYGITRQNYTTDALVTKLMGILPDLTLYLQENGSPILFTNPTASGTARIFNTQGKQALYTILFGALSVSNPPLLRQAGNNYYVLGGKPAGWPL